MKVELSKQAAKSVGKMDNFTKQRVQKAIIAIPNGDITPLKGSDGTLRLRVGGWRILFSYAENDTIIIEKIAPRGDVYKGV